MLVSSTLLLFAALGAAARPAEHVASVLTSPATLQHLPVGRTPLSRSDMAELARLAAAVNAAYCETNGKLPAGSSRQLAFHHGRGDHLQAEPRTGSTVMVSSSDREYAELSDEIDMSWYITHTPSTDTLTLALTSLPSIDDLLEVLASEPLSNSSDDTLLELPSYLFPPEHVPTFPSPRIHHSYLRALDTHGVSALIALLDIIERPPTPPISRHSLSTLLNPFVRPQRSSPSARPIKRVEIIGHGLGSAIALLISAALHFETSTPVASSYSTPLPPVAVRATLFGSPRVGDATFAGWVDDLVSTSGGRFTVHRITSYADTVAHLPGRHLEMSHPSTGEIWIGADPRTAFVCRARRGEESGMCAESVETGRTSLSDHAGPFGGVCIGQSACRRGRVEI